MPTGPQRPRLALGAVDVGPTAVAKTPTRITPDAIDDNDAEQQRIDLATRIGLIKTTTHGTRLLLERWPSGVTKPWPSGQLGNIARIVGDVEELAARPDDYWAVQDRFKALPADAHALGIAWANEATDAGHKLSTGTEARHRRIVNAMCMLLEATADADVCRDVLGLAMDDDIQPAVTLGQAWAVLTDTELDAVERFATAYRLGANAGEFDDAVAAMFTDVNAA